MGAFEHFSAGLLVSGLLVPFAISAQTQEQTRACQGIGNPSREIQIAACNTVIAETDQAIQVNPKSEQSYLLRGSAYLIKREYNLAWQDFDRAIQANPKSPEGYVNRAAAKEKMGNHIAAIYDLDTAIKINPNDASFYIARAFSKRRQGNYNEAIEDSSRAIKLDPKQSNAFLVRCIAYYKKNELERAQADCDSANKLEPKDTPSILYVLGLIKQKKGDVGGGAEDIAFAKALKPGIVDEAAASGVR
jgi:tetratricopeptide (TPR) repeat protein